MSKTISFRGKIFVLYNILERNPRWHNLVLCHIRSLVYYPTHILCSHPSAAGSTEHYIYRYVNYVCTRNWTILWKGIVSLDFQIGFFKIINLNLRFTKIFSCRIFVIFVVGVYYIFYISPPPRLGGGGMTVHDG